MKSLRVCIRAHTHEDTIFAHKIRSKRARTIAAERETKKIIRVTFGARRRPYDMTRN